ncbi:hypothetical protein GIY23_00040 [Allosaccharopolyspora coralli]|uniref:DUF3566 domain-containing protein n=1 Tax=Allosaccharopolyspora coralli TaxID=2665642 RepID=A0A5Q3QBL9_9PSEU|nr:DUF3566 domain-containing protein [Allosaccharopolyspora coralli]QGK68187.1 hypothetical protein GIY23_00040 [Allosaccharopolyspora coralli]
MTSSDKPENETSQSQQDAESSSVITESKADGTGSGTDAPATGATASQEQEELGGTDTPPPWQRGTASNSTEEVAADQLPSAGGMFAADSASHPDSESTQQIPRPGYRPGESASETASESTTANRTTVSFTGASSARSEGPGVSSRRPSRGPRRASLQIKRLDPWSVLKLALVLSVALFFVWMIAVAVLYGVLDGMGVWDQLNGTFTELTQPDDPASEPLISAGRVFGVASIIGAVNILLITALATVAAFIYNVAADFAGGVEVTLSERE